MFAVYSFITPALTQVSGFSLNHVPWILVLWGMGMVTGNIVGGRLADKALIPAIYGMIVWNIIFLGLFALLAQWKGSVLFTIFMLGNGFALVPALQAHMMNIAGDAQTLASSLTHSAFNISNALGGIFWRACYCLWWLMGVNWLGWSLLFFYRFNFNVFISTNDEKKQHNNYCCSFLLTLQCESILMLNFVLFFK